MARKISQMPLLGTLTGEELIPVVDSNDNYTITASQLLLANQLGTADGVASLDSNGKIPLIQLDDTILNKVEYKGNWDASTNTPSLLAPEVSKGYYYEVLNSGTYDGIDYRQGDWIISNGIKWTIVKNTESVTSVAGKTGDVSLDKADVGLNNVDNTSDEDKPVSIATQQSLDQKVDLSAYTDEAIKIKYENNPDTNAFTDAEKTKLQGIADGAQANQNALSQIDVLGQASVLADSPETIIEFEAGNNVFITTDPITNKITFSATGGVVYTAGSGIDITGDTISLTDESYTLEEKTKLSGIEAGAQVNTVNSVNGYLGDVNLTKVEIGLENVDNTSDLNKPISTATQSALDLKVDKEAGKQLTTEDFTTAYKDKLDGIDAGAQANEPTNLSFAGSGNTRILESSTGSDAVVPIATSDDAGFMSTQDKIKITSVQFGATANSTDAELRDRSTHTGTQSISTITGLSTELNNKISVTEKGIPSGVATLDSNGKVPLSQINDSLIGQVEFIGLWDANTNTPLLNIVPEQKGHYYIVSVAGTQFGIDFEVGDWLISIGTTWDKVDNTDAVSSVNGQTGVVVLDKTSIGLNNVDNTSDLDKPVSTATQSALDLKVDKVAGKQLSTEDYTTAEKDKLTGIAVGAEVNQYAYSFINVAGQSPLAADITTTTLNVQAGSNVAITTDPSTNTLTINSLGSGGSLTYDAGFGLQLSGTTFSLLDERYTLAEKNKLADIEAGAQENQFAISFIEVPGQDTITSSLYQDTVTLTPGSNVTITTDSITNNIVISATDTNTTYSAGTGITLTGTTFSLTGESYTTAEKTKLAGVETGAQVNTVDSVNGQTGVVVLDKTSIGLNNVDNTPDLDKPVSTATQSALDLKVDKVAGKQLSTEDYTTAEKTKLAGIAAGAQVNQNAFSFVSIDNTEIISSIIPTDTLKVKSGINVSLTVDPATSELTISSVNTTYTAGKGINIDGTTIELLDERFTTFEKLKLADIEYGAQVNAVNSVNGLTGDILLTKADIGLSNVDNTSDLDKLVSTATQLALDTKVDKVAGKQLSTEDYTTSEKDKLTGIEPGAQVNVGTDLGISGSGNIKTVTSSTGSGVSIPLATNTDAGLISLEDKSKLDNIEVGAQVNTVDSVNGQTGVVVLDKTSVGLSNVDNTSDLDKPVSTATQSALDAKVDKVAGKQLSTEDYTTAEKNKLASIETGAQVNTVDSVNGQTGVVVLDKTSIGLNNVDNTSDLDKPVSTATQSALDLKVDKVAGKQLSTEDYTSAEKTKLAGIETGAQVNVDTDLGISGTGNTRTITSSTGLGVLIPTATGTNAGFMSTFDKSKLDNIEVGAQVNTVDSVNGQTGVVVLDKTSIGLNNVDNTPDLDKPVSTATQSALDLKVDKVAGKQLSTEDYTTAEKNKLAGIETGAQVNQNAFGNISIFGQGSITADIDVDTFNVIAGSNVSITIDEPTNSFTISATNTDTTYSAGTGLSLTGTTFSLTGESYTTAEKNKLDGIETGAQVNVATNLAQGTRTTTTVPVTSSTGTSATLQAATTSLAGVMTSADKAKLDGIAAGAQVNQNAFSTFAVSGQDSVVADAVQDTLTLVAGSNVTITTNATTDTITISATDTNTTYSAGTGLSLAGTTFSLTGESYTTAEKTKLAGVETGAQVNTVDSVNGQTGLVVLDKTSIGLSNVDNTSDLNKPISTATQSVLDLKVDKVAGKQLSTEDYTTAEKTKLAGVETGAQVNTVDSVNGQTGVVVLDKTSIGLSNVDNTSDLNKPVSTATQLALDTKVDKVAGKQLSTEDYTSAEKNKLAGIAAGAQVNTVDSVNGQTGVVVLDKTSVGLSNVDNTSDLSKPISTATQSALDAKVDKVAGKQLSTEDYTAAEKTKLAGIETGAQVNTVDSVNGQTGVVVLDKTSIGLNNVDNTSDLDKPISTATQSALDAKVDKVAGKQLSTEDYTSAEKNKLAGIAAGAEVNQNAFSTFAVSGQSSVVADAKQDTLTLVAGSNVTITTNATTDTITISATDTNTTYSAGTGLSLAGTTFSLTGESYTTAEKTKLAGIETGAQVNVGTNLSVTNGTTAGPVINSSTGTNTTLPTASATISGVVTTGAQTFAGTKTFNNTIVGSITGNAGTSTKLLTPININGVQFDGSASITINAVDLTPRIAVSEKGIPNGVATLDDNGKVPLSQLNDSVLGQLEYQGLWNASTNTPVLSPAPVKKGDYYIVSNAGSQFSLNFEVGDWIVSNGVTWDKVDNTDAVSSVNGQTGVVVLDKTSIGLSNVDNTSDLNKPVSTATQSALDLKVDKVAGKQLSTEDYTTAEKTKLAGIAIGAEVNQNAFSTFAVSGQSSVVADAKQDTLTLVAGSNVAITTNATTDTITINSTNTTYSAGTGLSLSGTTFSLTGESYTTVEKNKLAGIAAGAQVNTVDSVNGQTGVVVLNKTSIGLSNVDNTSDLNKPISTATQSALDLKVDKVAGKQLSTEDYTTVEKNKLAGIAAGAEVNQNAFSTFAVSGQSSVVADAKQDTLTLVAGSNVAITTNATTDTITINSTNTTYSAGTGITLTGTTFSLSGESYTTTEKNKLAGIAAGAQVNTVDSVNGQTGVVVLDKTSIGLSNVDNTSDLDKPVSTATQSALDLKVDKVVGKQLSTEDYTTAEKNKLAGIAAGAQVNQNAFSTFAVSGQGSVVADAVQDTLTLVAGSNVTITTNATTDTITISATDTNTTYSAGTGLSLTGTTFSLAGESYTSAEKTKLAGIAAGAQVNVATNLAQGTRTTTTVPVTSSTGTSATLQAATTSLAGVMTSADKAKLDGIAAGATANLGTLTSIIAGDGLTGGTITNSGTITVDSSVLRNSGIQSISGALQITGNGTTAPLRLVNLGTTDPTSLASGDLWVRSDTLYARLGTTTRTIAHTSSWSAMSVAEGQTGTATTSRFMRADYLKQIIEFHASALDTTYSAGTGITLTGSTFSLSGESYTLAEKNKLAGIATGAEVNQNAFSSVIVSGQTTVASASKTQGLTLIAGSNITITTDNTAKSVTISATSNSYVAGTGLTLTGNTFSLSGESYTTAEKTKLAGIAAGAQVNVATNLAQGTRTTTTVPVTSSTGTSATLQAATTSLAGVMTSADKAKLDGIAAGAQVNVPTNLGISGTGDTRSITSSTGTGVQIPVTTSTNAGLMSTADKVKLDGIETGAQVNVATNLAQGTRTTTTVPVTSSTGTSATLQAATTSLAGVMTSADKAKLDGIAAGAQVNVGTNLGVTNGTTAGPTITSSTGTNVVFPTASATISGAVTTSAQTFAGTKTFTNGINNTQTISTSLNLALAALSVTPSANTDGNYTSTLALRTSTAANIGFSLSSYRTTVSTGRFDLNFHNNSATGTNVLSVSHDGIVSAPTFNATSVTNGGFQGIAADTVTTPSFTWTSNLNTGIYRPAANEVGIATNGTSVTKFTTNGTESKSFKTGRFTIEYNETTESLDFNFV